MEKPQPMTAIKYLVKMAQRLYRIWKIICYLNLWRQDCFPSIFLFLFTISSAAAQNLPQNPGWSVPFRIRLIIMVSQLLWNDRYCSSPQPFPRSRMWYCGCYDLSAGSCELFFWRVSTCSYAFNVDGAETNQKYFPWTNAGYAAASFTTSFNILDKASVSYTYMHFVNCPILFWWRLR